MNQIIIYLILFLSMTSFIDFQAGVFVSPIFDGSHEDRLPANFRTTKDVFALSSVVNGSLDKGLYSLSASGSGQFSECSLKELTQALSKSKLVVIDLRQESHGLINGKAVSWTDGNHNWANANKSLADIERDEKQRLRQAMETGMIIVNASSNPRELVVYSAQTEKECVESLGFSYMRIPVRDHCRPSNFVVDQFVELIKTLPSDAWLHFHCRAGRGRTTTFLTLYDMMINARQVDLETILVRHKLLGGTDLFRTHEPDNYKHCLAQERLDFVKNFYDYCRETPDFSESWSAWTMKMEETQVVGDF